MFPLSAVVCLAVLASAAATDVMPCKGRSAQGLSESVTLTPCKRARCPLVKGTTQHIQIEFTPEKQIDELKNNVNAEVFGVPLPFVGVDGISICNKIFTVDGDKAPCPLQAGTKYVYKDSFPILPIYPNIQVRVHWSLQDEERDIVCFELPTKITNSKA